MAKTIDAISFEKAMEKLEEIVDKLSEGKLPLEDMVKLYEEGSKLSAHCEKLLNAYSARIEVMDKTMQGAQGDAE